MQLFHGAHTTFALHLGQCFTDSRDSAEAYTQNAGDLTEIELTFAGLLVIDCHDVYDHDSDVAPGDDGNSYGGDVLLYSDEDARGQHHHTWRLMTQRAVDAVTLVSTSRRCAECDEWWGGKRDDDAVCSTCLMDCCHECSYECSESA